MFPLGLKQDRESHDIIVKMSKNQSKIPQPIKVLENLNSHVKAKPTEITCDMSQM